MSLSDSGGYIKFTPKYTIVGGEGGVLKKIQTFQTSSFGYLGAHAKFKNRSFTSSG